MATSLASTPSNGAFAFGSDCYHLQCPWVVFIMFYNVSICFPSLWWSLFVRVFAFDILTRLASVHVRKLLSGKWRCISWLSSAPSTSRPMSSHIIPASAPVRTSTAVFPVRFFQTEFEFEDFENPTAIFHLQIVIFRFYGKFQGTRTCLCPSWHVGARLSSS